MAKTVKNLTAMQETWVQSLGQADPMEKGMANHYSIWASLVAQMVKNLPAMQETQVGKIPWRTEWLPTPVFLPGEFQAQRNLVGYSPWGCKSRTQLSD